MEPEAFLSWCGRTEVKKDDRRRADRFEVGHPVHAARVGSGYFCES
jgi:hypothetical protein